TSYTAKLLSAGPSKVAKKIGEEGVELSLAIAGEPETSVIGESVDVIYHLLVGLRSRGVSLDDIAAEISSRHGLSGLEEKAQRET
ncbi:MAG: phosphoribosyl-ATP diphosphatase, partial [Pseudomonadota bacterium]